MALFGHQQTYDMFNGPIFSDIIKVNGPFLDEIKFSEASSMPDHRLLHLHDYIPPNRSGYFKSFNQLDNLKFTSCMFCIECFQHHSGRWYPVDNFIWY